MKSGHHIEFFLEGARTRSGKCCVPKGMLIKYKNMQALHKSCIII